MNGLPLLFGIVLLFSGIQLLYVARKEVVLDHEKKNEERVTVELKKGKRGSGECEPGKEYLPLQYVSRYPDTDECDYWIFRYGGKTYR